MTDSPRSPNRSFTRPTQKQSFEIGKMLHDVCHAEEREGQRMAVYDEGWDDRRIADALGVTQSAVEYRRVQMIGKLPVAIRPQPPREASADPAILQDMLAALKALSDRQDALNVLMSAMAERLLQQNLRLDSMADKVNDVYILTNTTGLTVSDIYKQLAACQKEYAGLREQVEKLF